MTINLKGKRIAVEKLKKVAKGNKDALGLVIPESEEYLGVVRLVSPEADQSVKVGQKVYFSTNFQHVRMGGLDLCVMEDSQVLATVED
jgi:co-chaperonin GroES (HSP10)